MLTQADFQAQLVANLNDSEVMARYQAGDPILVQQLQSIAAYFVLLGQEIEVATIEPFTKTRPRSIIADATNKGILPVATPCQHIVEVINNAANTVSLSAGRVIEDSQGGRPWRLLSSITVNSGQTSEVLVEQSGLREITYTVPVAEPFHQARVVVNDGVFLSGITVRDTVVPSANSYRYAPRWMNVAAQEYAVTITTDSMQRVFVQFGDDQRVGRTAQTNQKFIFTLIESYGFVDAARLKDAALAEVLNTDEQRVRVRFKQGGLVRAGADPLTVSELKLLSSYPALYDENAVFLGNFDYLARSKFMKRTNYLTVWNETIQERMYGVTWQDINHLHLAVVAKTPAEQATIENDIRQLIGRADSLFDGRIKVRAVVERPYHLTVTGKLAGVYDIDTVKNQIRNLLTAAYGKGTLAASRWLADGINTQEVSTLLRDNITAFQDRMYDFVVTGENLLNNPVKPHEWLYLTNASISVDLSRTADTGGSLWTY